MIPVEEALAAYPNHLRSLGSERISVAASLDRVLADNLHAQTDLPRFDQSAMDGYALRSADTSSAPGKLPVIDVAAAGGSTIPKLLPGSAMRIFTGARIPEGADTVAPQERVTRNGDHLEFTEPHPSHKNIRYQGEELRSGAAVAKRGKRVTPGLLSACISAGVESLQAVQRPRIAVLVSGDEVRPFGSELALGEIPDSNGPLVEALLTRWGYAAPASVHVRDDERDVRAALGEALDTSDLVITTGGASVGDRDFLPGVAQSLGVQKVFWKVAQKPGKPMLFGVRDRTALISLPGNPAAVLVGMLVHVRRVLDVLEGMQSLAPAFLPGQLAAPVKSDAQRVQFLRMRVELDDAASCLLHPLPNQDSHMLSNLAEADALAWIPRGDSPLPATTIVRWLRIA